jgi:hypothetical protein
MLETLLHIGKTLRSAGLMRHHRYIKPAPPPDLKLPVVYLSLPVVNDGSDFDFDSVSEIHDEIVQQNKLFYLTFKSSETDNAVKYVFGDILYGVDKGGKDVGYYKMESDKSGLYGKSSFNRGKDDAQLFKGTIIQTFRDAFEQNIQRVEALLKEYGQSQRVFLHFDFNGKHWYEFEHELEAINQALLSYFVEAQGDYYVLRNFLYKTLISGDSQSPDFSSRNIYKAKAFRSNDEVMDLVYAIDYSKKALISDRDIKIVILPKGHNLTATQIERFFDRYGVEDEDQAESNASESNRKVDETNMLDSLFEPTLNSTVDSITQFDFIFSKKGQKGLDVDMVEISGIERSFLARTSERVKEMRESLREERDSLYPKRPKQFAFLDIRKSFLNILGDVTTDKKKYQNHLFKVLPQIYSGAYHRDDVLLPAFIEKTEYNVRNGAADYHLLKYDYYFLARLRNTNGDDPMDEIKHSKSYQAGLLIGRMAQPLDRKIASFEKNYVGLLSRRISDKQGLINFANFINEKLAIHDVAYSNLKQASVELAGLISGMSDREYRKNYCAFGFFEGYFSRRDGAVKTVAQAADTQVGDNNQ